LQGKPKPHHPAIARMFSPYDEFDDRSEGGRRWVLVRIMVAISN